MAISLFSQRITKNKPWILVIFIAMSSRNSILDSIKKNKPAAHTALPLSLSYEYPQSNSEKLELFIKHLQENAARVVTIQSNDQAVDLILSNWQDHDHIHAPMFPYIHNTGGTIDALAQVDISVVKARIGVVNNGAMWIVENDLEHRSVPFLAKYLAILIDKDDLVNDLHEAYAKIDTTDFGYGVWISGPSKTGDIEQALVIGAHGPIETLVILKV